MFIKEDNKIAYKTWANPDGVMGSSMKEVQRVYVGDGDDLGLSIYKVNSSLFNGYIISDKPADDIEFITNIPQFESGIYELDMSIVPNLATFYKKGSKKISIGLTESGSTSSLFGLYHNAGYQPNDDIHSLPRYGRDGVLLTYYDVKFLSRSNHNSESEYELTSSNTSNSVAFMTLKGESQGDVSDAADLAFDAQGYKHSTRDAGNWSGWIKDIEGGISGEYQPFGGAEGTKEIGFQRYQVEGFSINYLLDIDIIKNEAGEYEVTYADNGKIYKAPSRPNKENTVFTNQDADPQQITLLYRDLTSYSKPETKITMMQVVI